MKTGNQTPNKILCLQPSSIFEGYGGAEYYTDDLLTACGRLLGKGKVRTLVPQRTEKFRLQDRPYEIIPVPFLKGKVLGKIENRLFPSLFRAALKSIREFKPDLIVCAHVSLSPLAYLLQKITGVPYYTVALGIETWGNLLPQDEWALKYGAGILSISHWTKSILVKRGYNAEKIWIVHPTLNESFEKIPEPRRKSSEENPFRLLTLSRLDPAERYKGHDHVLKALENLRQREPDLKLEYRIQGDGADRDRLEKLAAEYRLTDWVRFQPSVRDRNDLKDVYKDSDLFIMPSRFGRWDGKWKGEGFGIVYVEAGAFGVPSIAYNCGGATDIIRQGESGILVEPDNTEALASAILTLVKDREKVLKMGKKAYEVAMGEFTPSVMQNQLKDFFESRS